MVLDIFQQFTFVIKQKEQHTDLNISNNTNRYDRQKQNIIYKKKSANNEKLTNQMRKGRMIQIKSCV